MARSAMTVRDSDVRFRGQSGHPLGLDECRLMTRRRHRGHVPPTITFRSFRQVPTHSPVDLAQQLFAPMAQT